MSYNINKQKKKILISSYEHTIPNGGLAIVGNIISKSDFAKRYNRMNIPCIHLSTRLGISYILLHTFRIQRISKPSFGNGNEIKDDSDFYKDVRSLLHNFICRTPLQRLDIIGSSIHRQIFDENILLLKSNGIVSAKLLCVYILLT